MTRQTMPSRGSISPQLVKRVNAIYHDVEASLYNARHEKTTEYTEPQLQVAARAICRHLNSVSLNCMDVGTGTALVPMSLARILGRQESAPKMKWILSDISVPMLQVGRSALEKNAGSVQGCLVMDAECPALRESSLDIITVRSVLHHLPSPDVFLNECRRLLRQHGLLVVLHEPTLGYYESTLWRGLRLTRATLSRLRLSRRRRPKQEALSESASFWQEVEKRLERAGITGYSRAEIQSLVDVHSPTSRDSLNPGLDCGVDFYRLLTHGWCLLEYGTYAHLGKLSFRFPAKSLANRADLLLRHTMPKGGSLFYAVARKVDM